MDYSTTDFDNNPFANEGGFGSSHGSSISSSSQMFGNDDHGGFGQEDHRRFPGTAAAGLFGGEDNSPAGGLLDEHHAGRAALGEGFGSAGGHEEVHRTESPSIADEQQQQALLHHHQQPGEQHQKPPPSPVPRQPREALHQHKHDHHQYPQPQQRRKVSGGDTRGQAQGQRQIQQYRLQAKVTALERLGRKDPVIRFDVHVRPHPQSHDSS